MLGTKDVAAYCLGLKIEEIEEGWEGVGFYMKVRINLVKHTYFSIIQNQTMYARTQFRCAKHAKLGRPCFGPFLKNQYWLERDGHIKKNIEKCVFRVCLPT